MNSTINKIRDFISQTSVTCIIIVENDITPYDNIETAFNFYMIQTLSIRKFIIEELKEHDKKLAEDIQTFESEYIDLTQYEIEIIKSNVWEKVWERRGLIIADANKDLVSIRKDLSSYDDVFFKILLKYGIFKNIGRDYEFLQNSSIISINVPIIYYDSITPSTVDDILTTFKSHTPYKNLIAIIDKNMGDESIKGDELIINLRSSWDIEKSSIFSCILTSQPTNDDPISTTESFFVYQIEKDEDVQLNILKYLTLGAFTKLMDLINLSYRDGISDTLDLSRNNPLNLAKLLEKSKGEDIQPFKVLTNWFSLASSYFSEKYILQAVNDWSMHNIVDESITYDSDKFTQDRPDLEELNVFEHFDYSVNKCFSPIAPGDIFFIDEKYFILVGQSCDLSIRSQSNNRKVKVADLLQLEILDKSDKKIEETIKDNVKILNINHFEKDKSIRILFNKSIPIELKALDLCSFSKDGVAKLSKDSKLSEDIIKILPQNRDHYYYHLYEEAYKIAALDNETRLHLNDLNPMLTFSKFDIKENRIIKWNIKRICRIKEPLQQKILNLLSIEKSKIGFNNIDPSIVFSYQIKLSYGLPGIQHKETDSFNYVEGGSIDLSKLRDYIDDDYLKYLDNYNLSTIKISKATKKVPYSLEINGTIAKLVIGYKFGNDYIHNSTINFRKLFNQEPEGECSYLDGPCFDAKKVINIQDELVKGIKYLDYIAIMKDGIITVEKSTS